MGSPELWLICLSVFTAAISAGGAFFRSIQIASDWLYGRSPELAALSGRGVGDLHSRSGALRLRDLASRAYLGGAQPIQSYDVVADAWPGRWFFHGLAVYGGSAALADTSAD